MKICIITQPLHNNYGGILQAYALQRTLREMGHDVVTDRYGAPHRRLSTPKRLFKLASSYFRFYVLRSKRASLAKYQRFPKRHRQALKFAEFDRFVDQYFRTIDLFKGRCNLRRSEVECFDAFVSGSDQIWRTIYSNVSVYFLDFTNRYNVKRVSYAASFGKDTIEEYSPRDIRRCREAAAYLDLVSVREQSGVGLCKEHFGVEAQHVLDPTLLLNSECYDQLLGDISKSAPALMSYILDVTEEKEEIVSQTSSALGLEVRKFSNQTNGSKPSIEQWIAAYRDAEFIVTDSFHGTVFSIIYQKPFVAISNAERGASRFLSLLSIFGLEHRLISSIEELSDDLIHSAIDYHSVNSIKKQWQANSRVFLAQIF